MSRPSAKSIYNGREVSSIDDCVNRLKNMDSKGKVWGQDMIMQVQANQLQLCDIETKEFLESVHLSSIRVARAVLDSCVYDSLLIISVQDPSQRAPQAFLFQCEEIGVRNNTLLCSQELIYFLFLRSHLESIIGRGYPGSMKRPVLMQSNPPPPEFPPPQYNNYEDYGDHLKTADIEIFTYKVGSALPEDDGSKKKKKKNAAKQFGEKLTHIASMPPVEEYISCLQKIKYGFNLLVRDAPYNPSSHSVPECFFMLQMVSQYPPNIPPTVLSPLLTEKALHLLGRCVTPNEDVLWGSLGDAWSIPRSKWPNGNQIPPYYPEFYDCWQPLPPGPSLSPPSSRQLSRSNSERFPPRNAMQRSPEQVKSLRGQTSAYRSAELPLYMRVIYDFMARNSQELSVMQGDMVQITDKSGQWWKVKNSRNEDGYVPQNVLEPVDGQRPTVRPPSLDMNSRPEEVKAWLQYKGFSKMTVQTLGVFNGAMLLGMKRDDIRAICPEEGGRVFFQLQSVRSTIALASEAEYSQYGGR
uniref:Epidermal growth factor receptor kinase substrate 8-like protein 3 n=1 Tax=Sinocyclocheilus rhinocerous TaxID=307959 RepID=A0A673I3Y2_9TELE